MDSRVFRHSLIFCVVLSVGAAFSVHGQSGTSSGPAKKETSASRLAQLVEANIIATHAYQVLLAKKSGKGDPNCFGAGRLADSELEALVEHQLNYDEAYRTAQDYDLWIRLLKYAKGANLIEALIFYRIRHGITRKKKQEQLNNTSLIAFRMVQQELPELKIDREQFTSLWTLHYVNHGRADAQETDWVASCELYQRLFKSFADKYSNRKCLGKVKREQGITVMRSAVRSSFPRGWVGILSELISEDPWLPVAFSLHLVRAAVRIGKSRLLKRAEDGTPL
jgi:hypothetical protein